MPRHLAPKRRRPRGRIAALSVVLALSFGIAAVAQTPQSDRDLLISIHQQLHAAGIPDTPTTASTSTTATTAPTTSSTVAPTTTATTAPPTTSTTVAPTTSTTVAPTTTTTGAPAQYGTNGTGPGLEPCTTAGTIVTTSAAVSSGPQNSVILMRAGTYSTGFTVPAGSLVKPYNCELVQINDNVAFGGNNSAIAGLRITANADGWALRITGRTNVEIRNSIIKGGTTEAIRIDGPSNNVRLLANHIDGGDNNHTIKVTSNSGGGSPTNVVLRNNLLTKIHFGGGEDLLQLEGHGVVTVDHNTFRDNPSGEDGMDVKNGQGVSITGNDFQGATINFECLLVQGDLQPMLVQGNKIDNCFASLGAHPEGNHNPSWDFLNNLLSNGATLRLRRSFDAEMRNNTWTGGGQVILGTSTSGDYPRNAFFSGNAFGSASWSVNNGSSNYICDGTNSGTGGAGGACS